MFAQLLVKFAFACKLEHEEDTLLVVEIAI